MLRREPELADADDDHLGRDGAEDQAGDFAQDGDAGAAEHFFNAFRVKQHDADGGDRSDQRHGGDDFADDQRRFQAHDHEGTQGGRAGRDRHRQGHNRQIQQILFLVVVFLALGSVDQGNGDQQEQDAGACPEGVHRDAEQLHDPGAVKKDDQGDDGGADGNPDRKPLFEGGVGAGRERQERAQDKKGRQQEKQLQVKRDGQMEALQDGHGRVLSEKPRL